MRGDFQVKTFKLRNMWLYGFMIHVYWMKDVWDTKKSFVLDDREKMHPDVISGLRNIILAPRYGY